MNTFGTFQLLAAIGSGNIHHFVEVLNEQMVDPENAPAIETILTAYGFDDRVVFVSEREGWTVDDSDELLS